MRKQYKTCWQCNVLQKKHENHSFVIKCMDRTMVLMYDDTGCFWMKNEKQTK